MKKSKVLATFLCGAMLLSLASCGNNGGSSSSTPSSSTPVSSEPAAKSDLSEPGVLPIWQGEGTPEIGADGFMELYPEAASLQQAVLQLFYEQVE